MIIKPADKSGNIVLLDKVCYRKKTVLTGHPEYNTYEKVYFSEGNNVMKYLKRLVAKHKNALTVSLSCEATSRVVSINFNICVTTIVC